MASGSGRRIRLSYLPATVELEAPYELCQPLDPIRKRVTDRAGFFDHCRVLLGHLIDFVDGRCNLLKSDSEGSIAARAGLQPDDIVVAIDRRPVADVGQVLAALVGENARTLVTVLRNGHHLFVAADAQTQ